MAFTALYLTNRTAPYTPATIRGTWDDTAGAVTRALDPKKTGGGTITSVARAETSATNPFSVLLYRGVSGPLAAATINTTLDILAGILENNASADFHWKIHAYVTQGDSDTPRGTLLTNYTEGAGVNEWPTTATGKQLNAAQAMSSLAIQDGDRLVVEIGYIARNSVTTSFTGTLRYGTITSLGQEAADLTNGSTSVTTLAGFLTFGASIAEFEAALDSRVTMAGTDVATTVGVSGVRTTMVGVDIGTQNNVFARVTMVGVDVGYIPADIIPDPPGDGDLDDGVDPTEGGDLCGAEVVAFWCEITPVGSSTTYRYAKGQINLGHPKDARAITLGKVRRSLTTRGGTLAMATVESILSDHDRVLRGLEDTDSLINGRIEFYGTTQAHARAHRTSPSDANAPRRVFSGRITDTEPLEEFQFRIVAADELSQLLDKTVDREPVTYPQYLFGAGAFPTIGNSPDDEGVPGNPEIVGKPVPIVYGICSDETIDEVQSGVVLFDTTQGNGGSIVEGQFPAIGWTTVGVTGPGSLSLSEAAGGNFQPGEFVRVLVTAVVGGVETDPFPLPSSSTAGQLFTFSGSNQKLVLSCGAVGGASAYRWYVNKSGAWDHTASGAARVYRETAGNSTELTDPGDEGVGPFPPPDTNWSEIPVTGPAYVAIIAVTPTGLTKQPTGDPYFFGSIKLGPWATRPSRIGWEAFTDATEYWVFIEGAPAKKFIVASSATHFDFSPALTNYTPVSSIAAALAPAERTGVVVAYFVGRRFIGGSYKDEYLVSGAAPGPGGILRIQGELSGSRQPLPDAYYGTYLWAPGHEPSWSALTGSSALYRDYAGHRHTTFFATGPVSDSARTGKVPFTVNMGGKEDVGDGTGNVITSIALQLLDILNNSVVQTGNMLAPTAYPELNGYSLFNTESFKQVQARTEERISGGHLGAFVFGHGLRGVTFGEIVALAHDHGVDIYIDRHGRIAVSTVDATLASSRSVDDVDDSIKRSFRAARRRPQIATRILFRYARRYAEPLPKTTPDSGDLLYLDTAQPRSEWNADRQERYAAGALVQRYGVRTKEISFEWTRDKATAEDLAEYHGAILQGGPVEVIYIERLCATNTELGDVNTLDHVQGMTSLGYIGRPLRCEVHELDMDALAVWMQFLDLEPIPQT